MSAYRGSTRWQSWLSAFAGVLPALALAALTLASPARATPDFTSARCNPAADGSNPCPISLTRPKAQPLSSMGELGRLLFFDEHLSGSGRQSCASCHSPANHYAPPANAPDFALGGVNLHHQGRRAVPSLAYLEHQPPFSIGPDNATSEAPPAPPPSTVAHPTSGKSAQDSASSATNMVPQGGLFWDGRADTLQQQALGPLFNPDEMAANQQQLLHYLQHSPYTALLTQLAGPAAIKANPALLIDEAAFAISQYEHEGAGFHHYNSKYDRWLEGQYRFTPAEQRGYLLFNDPQKGNCAACHLSHPGDDGHSPPLFTDTQYEALGAPHNPHAPAGPPDLGLCQSGRVESNTAGYCGFFKTPSLRNTATRGHFFHNSVFHTLGEVLGFYAHRPPPTADLPAPYRANLDTSDAPFNHPDNAPPALTQQEQADIIAFLKALTDQK